MTRRERETFLVRLRSALIAAAAAAGKPEGVGPSMNDFDDWAEARGSRVRADRVCARVAKVEPSVRRHYYRARWTDVVRVVGLEPPSALREITAEDVVRDLRRVSTRLSLEGKNKFGEMPSKTRYRKLGQYDPQTVLDRLVERPPGSRGGSWGDAAFAAGLEPSKRSKIYGSLTFEGAVEDYRRLSIAAGYTPGGYGLDVRSFQRRAGYTTRHLARFAEIAEAAGFRVRDACRPRGEAETQHEKLEFKRGNEA